MKIVIDASAVAGWLIESQATPSADRFLDEIDRRELHAPYVFAWEMRNLLLRRSRRGLDLKGSLAALALYGIEIAPAPGEDDLSQLVLAADAHFLSLFDTAYLALALELDASLASRDAQLINAARIEGIEVFDLRG